MPLTVQSILTGAVVVGLAATTAPAAAAPADVLEPTTEYEAGWGPFSVTIGDFDGSGREDLAVMNHLDSTVSVLAGRKGGDFGGSREIAVGSRPLDGAAADFNEDGVDDLATANSGSGPDGHTVSILISKGSGGFNAPRHLDVGGSSRPSSIDSGDFNHDGHTDLAVTLEGYVDVAVLLGNGDGTFSTTRFGVPFNNGLLTGIAVGDFDGDGQADLAVADHYFSDVIVFRGNGDGTFDAGTRYGVDARPTNVELADFDEDGNLDIVTANDLSYTQGAHGVSVLFGNGDGTFQPYRTYLSQALAVGVGDFNGDCHADIAAVFGDVDILLGDGNGGFSIGQELPAGKTPYLPAASDFDDDGADDLAVPNQTDYPGTVSVALSTGSGGCGLS